MPPSACEGAARQNVAYAGCTASDEHNDERAARKQTTVRVAARVSSRFHALRDHAAQSERKAARKFRAGLNASESHAAASDTTLELCDADMPSELDKRLSTAPGTEAGSRLCSRR